MSRCFRLFWNLFERKYSSSSKEMLWTTFFFVDTKTLTIQPFSCRSAGRTCDTFRFGFLPVRSWSLVTQPPGWRDSIKCWWWEISFMVVYCENEITQVRKTWVDSGFLYDSDQLPLTILGVPFRSTAVSEEKNTDVLCMTQQRLLKEMFPWCIF